MWPNFSPVPSAVSDRNRCSPTRVISAKVETIGVCRAILAVNGYRAEDGWFILDTQTRCEAVIGVQIGVIDRGVKTRVGLIYLDKGALV